MRTAFVSPKSKKAKNRFINMMDSIDEVIVEQMTSTKAFVTSLNKKYHCWINLVNDNDWSIDF
jgi:hypothetical protein